MDRRRRLDALRQLKEQQSKRQPAVPVATDEYWDDLIKRLDTGNVIPFISNSLRCDHIFAIDGEPEQGPTTERDINGADSTAPSPTAGELLAEMWAGELGYPFPDRNRLARVAQYNLFENCGAMPEKAKAEYLAFLRKTLLSLVEKRIPDARERVDKEKDSFSHIVRELGIPQFQSQDKDTLRLLARFRKLKIYVTTCYYDFVERALEAAGRRPRTQICFWSGVPANVEPEHRLDRSYLPSPDEPVVLHLFGHEKYPSTMVLTEDDYVDFLIKVSQPVDPEAPIIPLYLTAALPVSTLLLLGYRLQDWDFRTLFRGIIHAKPRTQPSELRLAIQLKPSPQDGIVHVEKAQTYLEKYFDSSDFRVVWEDDPDTFVRELWRKSKEGRQNRL